MSASKPTSTLPAHLLAFGAVYALLATTLRLAVHWSASTFGADWHYRLGCAQGLGIDLLIGMAAGLAWALRPGSLPARALSLALAFGFLLGNSTGAHFHAVFNSLPEAGTLRQLTHLRALSSSLAEHTPLWALAAETLPAIAILWAATPRLAARTAELLRTAVARRIAAVVVATLVVAALGGAATLGGQRYYGCAGPWVHVATSSLRIEAPSAASTPAAERLAYVQRALGVENTGPPSDPDYPLCRERPPGQATSEPPRSVILLLLESVDARELEATYGGEHLMPNLQRIRDDGVHFTRFYAAGYVSNQALPAIFSGVPALLRKPLLQSPLVRFDGLPRMLQESGYATVYLHGGDLSFEQQRSFLSQVGFARLIEPNPLRTRPLVGWGLPDGVTFTQLRSWIGKHRRRSPQTPYLAALSTLSTHDPFTLPKNYAKRLGNADGDDGDGRGPLRVPRRERHYARFSEALRYLDAELGKFYDWYEVNERPRGTLLVITGDHGSRIRRPDDPLTSSTGEFEYRFRVPLIINGLGEDEEALARGISARIGGQHDLPQTLLGRLGIDGPHCFQGRDLFGPQESWPESRYVLSTAGESLQFFYVHAPDGRWMFDLRDRTVRLFDPDRDPYFEEPLSPPEARLAGMKRLLRDYAGLTQELLSEDRFSPSPELEAEGEVRVESSLPIIVSHQGNVVPPNAGRGARAGKPGEPRPAGNTLPAFEAAVEAGARWIEMDVQITADSVPVVHHDRIIHLPGAGPVEIRAVTRKRLRALLQAEGKPYRSLAPGLELVLARLDGRVGLCIELKVQKDVLTGLALARETMRALEKHSDSQDVIVDSFSRVLLDSVRTFGRWQVGYDLPQGPVESEWLAHAAEMDFDWIYVDYRFITPHLIEVAHRSGLKLMAYTVNDRRRLGALDPRKLDGIITDHLEIWSE